MNKSSKVADAYKALVETEGGKLLIKWIEESSNTDRRNASRSQDTAYGELRFADGKEAVLVHIKTMCSIKPDSKAS